MEDYKVIEDEKTKDKIRNSEDLFSISDFYSYYYFFLNNKFYMAQSDSYSSPVFPRMTFYRITFEKFKKGLKKYKADNKDEEDYEFRLLKIEKLLKSINEEEIVKIEKEERKKEITKKLKKELKVLRELKKEAEKLGISDEDFNFGSKVKAKIKEHK